MNVVGMYRKSFPFVSETFITEQASKLSRYQPFFITCRKIKEISFEHISLSDNDFLNWKQIAYSLTRSPQLFDRSKIPKQLKLIHAHFGTDGIYAMKLAERWKVPFLVSFYGYDATVSLKTLRQAPLSYQLLLYEEQLKQKASVFITISQSLQKKLIERGYPQEKIIQNYLGTDINRFSPSERSSNERYILCVGRHTEKKGIDTLLRAFSRIASKHPDVSLVQVGSGPLSADLHALATQLAIENKVRFLGSQPYETVLNLTRQSEIFALSSQTARNGDSEGLPCVIVEASACGVPVVGTYHSGIPEAVLDGETGFLVAEKDAQALAEKIDILLSDRNLGEKMGRQGREFVCEFFDAQKQAAKLEQIYDSLIC